VLKTIKSPLEPLRRAEYPKVKFWTEKAFNEARNQGAGETNGLATEKRRPGRPRKSSDLDDELPSSYPWLETANGERLSSDTLTDISRKLRRLFESLVVANLAPTAWGSASEAAHDFIHLEMGHAFDIFRFCEGGWKLHKYITTKYSGFARARWQVDSDNGTRQRKWRRRSTEEPEYQDDEDQSEETATPSDPETPGSTDDQQLDDTMMTDKLQPPADDQMRIDPKSTENTIAPLQANEIDRDGTRAGAEMAGADPAERDAVIQADKAPSHPPTSKRAGHTADSL